MRKRKRKISFILFALLVFSTPLLAQKGFLRGKVIDDEFGDGLIGATIVLEGSNNSVGTVSDFNGDYSLPLEAGTHTIVFSSVSYATITINDVVIKPGDVTVLDIRMKPESTELAEIVVQAEALKDSEEALLTMQKKSPNVVDGISTQSFRKIGDSNLSSAMNRVTGVSVEGGKYVYVRGLGDRYTKTTLNEMNIPGLDPDRNAVQIDIFPTSTIENVVVYKTFSANIYGDFTGGMVNIDTKNFPEDEHTSFSIGASYNPSVTFNNDFVLYKGGNLDFLGFDDGTRALPFNKNTSIPNEVLRDPKLEELTRSFSSEMGVKKMTALPGGSFSLSHGNQINRTKATWGYNLVLNYKNENDFYDNFQSNTYLKDPETNEKELFRDESRTGIQAQNNVLWSGLASGALKYQNHSFATSLLRSQNGTSTALQRTNKNFNQTGAVLLEQILTYTQRSVTNWMLIGKHHFNKSELEWRNAATWSRVYDPDFRTTTISISGGDTTLQMGDGAGISRIFRDLNEFNESFKVDYTIPYGQKNKLMVGAVGTYKKRDFEILNYSFDYTRPSDVSIDPDWFFESDRIWQPDTREGTYVIGNFEPANSFNAHQLTISGYAMTELQLTDRLRSVVGARIESNKMYYTGQNNAGTKVFKDSLTLDNLNVLPSVNLVYKLQDNMNLRASYNKTLARPNFAEKSVSQIFDPISRRTRIGNIDLKQTNIDNFDLRWEYYIKPGELLSISGFYKKFDGHIELVSFDTAPDNVTPRNSGSSTVVGAEMELRKNLDVVSPALENFSLGTNLSIIRSYVDMKSIVVNGNGDTEYDLRVKNSRQGEDINSTRSMAGQAPYLVNAYLNYSDKKSLWNVNLSYNVQGETLTVVGSGLVPDVYSDPFHSLNFNMYRSFGKELRSKITFGVENILNETKTTLYKSYGAESQIYQTYNPGRTFSLKYSFDL